MILTITLASALVLGTIKEVSSAQSKKQEIETLKRELKLRKGQIDLLLSQKSIMLKKQLNKPNYDSSNNTDSFNPRNSKGDSSTNR